MLYLLASQQLLLSESAPHDGDSWAAVFLCCTYLHLSSFSCPSLPRITVTAGQLFFMMYLLASQQLLLSQSAPHHGDSLAAVFMLYLLASQQLLLSESAAHHGDSWDAVFTIFLPAIQHSADLIG